jgi:flagellar basal body-associated protein FliL
MKKAMLFILLFVISLQFLIKGVYVAYYHLNKSYIAATLCEKKAQKNATCQGKCYLSKKIKQQDPAGTQLPEAIKNIKECIVFVESLPLLTLEKLHLFLTHTFSSLVYSYKNLFVNSILQPPQ